MVGRQLVHVSRGRTFAALLLLPSMWATAILISPTTPASRLQGGPYPSSCVKPLVSKASADCRKRPRYDARALAIPQISPAIRRARALRLDEFPCPLCAPSANGNGRSLMQKNERSDLIDSLLQPPSPSSIAILREYNIPIIPDVPPIVILQQPRDHERSRPIRGQNDR